MPTGASPEELITKLKDLYGSEATVDMESGSLSVEYDLNKCKEEFIEMTLIECGFKLDDSIMERISHIRSPFLQVSIMTYAKSFSKMRV